MAERYEYKVVEVRESLVGGKMSGGKLEKLLNDYAAPGLAAQGDHQRGREGSGGTWRSRGFACHLRAPYRLGRSLRAHCSGRQVIATAVIASCRRSQLGGP
jgi:hypothetical protein